MNVFLALHFLPLAIAAHATPLRVVIDPGHGGRDTGAVHSGVQEADLVYRIASRLARQLNSDRDFSVGMTRDTDQFLTLGERVNKMNSLQPDIILSIHANSSTDTGARGVEVYVRNLLPADEDSIFLVSRENSNEGEHSETAPKAIPQSDVRTILDDLKRQNSLRHAAVLSHEILHRWPTTRNFKRRAVRQAPFYVITQLDVPAVLVEVGYVSNPSEARWLQDATNQELIATTLHNALRAYLPSLTAHSSVR